METSDNSVNAGRIIKEINKKASLVKECEKRGISLQEISGGKYKGLCPFHDEKTPSFFIFDEGENTHYHCFGCGAHGNSFKFVNQYEKKRQGNWSFKKTVDYFSSFLPISSSKDISELDISYFMDNYEDSINKKDKTLLPRLIRSSEKIRNFLKKSSNPNRDLREISGTLKKIDEIYSYSSKEPFIESIERLGRLMDNIDVLRPELDLYIKSLDCNKCDFCIGIKKSLFGKGNIHSGVFIVSNFPSQEDIKNEQIFSGKKSIVKKILLNKDIYYNDYWMTNVALCFGDKNNIEEAKKCMQEHLFKEINLGKPKKMVVLGSFARSLIDPENKNNIENIIGKSFNLKIAGRQIEVYFNYSIEYIINTGEFESPFFKNFKNQLLLPFEKKT